MEAARISVRIDEQLHRELQAFARASGRSESEIVREALKQIVRTRNGARNCYQLAEQLGVIGSAQNLPRDLSRATKHMKGFGR